MVLVAGKTDNKWILICDSNTLASSQVLSGRVTEPSRKGLLQIGQASVFFSIFFGTRSSSVVESVSHSPTDASFLRPHHSFPQSLETIRVQLYLSAYPLHNLNAKRTHHQRTHHPRPSPPSAASPPPPTTLQSCRPVSPHRCPHHHCPASYAQRHAPVCERRQRYSRGVAARAGSRLRRYRRVRESRKRLRDQAGGEGAWVERAARGGCARLWGLV